MKYQPQQIEGKWQDIWEKKGVYQTPTHLETLKTKPKFYVLDMFPYPSGAGLHVGHPEGYTATDVVARLKRMQGFHVLHPMGWDAFGLPAERAAVRDNIHPAIITKRNVDNFRRQIKRLGFSYDWNREIDTSSPEYYKWTQWIFLKLYEKNLAYLSEVAVNWCPALCTVLANEEVKDGKYVETGDPVERRLMKQWMLKITAYAERLITDLDDLDWPESVKDMQRHWIGKSFGAEINFDIKGQGTFTVFTTRADTLFGATYCVLAPEHPLVERITTASQHSTVSSYVAQAKQKSDLMRTDLAKEKSGVFTGAYATHPITQKPLPIWVADYVLMSYGTGAIMAVPAHDERDHAFATLYALPIQEVISGANTPVTEKAFTEDGVLIHSDFLNGLSTDAAQKKMVDFLEKNNLGKGKVQYRLRDWLFSRQRYWGEPFPVVHLQGSDEVIPLSTELLPVELPAVDEFKPTDDGRPPLARAGSWLTVTLPDGRKAMRETNTMPQWAGSCWYYLRYIDPHNDKEFCNRELEKYWMPVDLYIGGVEHAVLHLLYARFWHKVLYDCGLVSTKEPFQKLFNQGMILAYSYRDAQGKYYHPNDIVEKEGRSMVLSTGVMVEKQIEKMSKSKLNVVNPDDVIDRYGADAMRLYELFMGPLEQTKAWQMEGVEGISRFLNRVWRLVIDEQKNALSEKIIDAPGESQPDLWKSLHKTTKKVAADTLALQFNTAISQMMIFVNEATAVDRLPKPVVIMFLKVLAPYAPHLAEELWAQLKQPGLVVEQTFPTHDEALCMDQTVTLVFQVNGKMRGKIDVPRDLDSKEVEALALKNDNVLKFLEGKTPKKIIVVPNRLVNLVI